MTVSDTGFSIGTGFNTTVNAMAVQSDGKIVVGGEFFTFNGVTKFRILRLNADGSLDTGFLTGTGSFASTNGFSSNVRVVALQPDGKILIGGGFTEYQGVTQNRITRLNTDGTQDGTFDIGTGFNAPVEVMAIQSDGKIVVGGGFTSYNGTGQNRITRLNSNGSLDINAGFSIDTGFNGSVVATAIQSDGKILAGGNFTTYNGVTQNMITRLMPDGTLDTGFSIGTGFNSTAIVRVIVLQTDGKIVVGGGPNMISYNGVTQNRITRLMPDGSLDIGFSIGTGFNATVLALALQPDGKILAGGNFITYNGITQNRITRLMPDGSRDTTFDIGTGFNDEVRTIAQYPGGKILIGGAFTSYNGVTQNRIVRFNANGTPATGNMFMMFH